MKRELKIWDIVWSIHWGLSFQIFPLSLVPWHSSLHTGLRSVPNNTILITGVTRLSPCLSADVRWPKHDYNGPSHGFNVGFLSKEFPKLLSPGERVKGSSVTEALFSTLGKQISIRYNSDIRHILPTVCPIILAKLCFLSIKVQISLIKFPLRTT